MASTGMPSCDCYSGVSDGVSMFLTMMNRFARGKSTSSTIVALEEPSIWTLEGLY